MYAHDKDVKNKAVVVLCLQTPTRSRYSTVKMGPVVPLFSSSCSGRCSRQRLTKGNTDICVPRAERGFHLSERHFLCVDKTNPLGASTAHDTIWGMACIPWRRSHVKRNCIHSQRLLPPRLRRRAHHAHSPDRSVFMMTLPLTSLRNTAPLDDISRFTDSNTSMYTCGEDRHQQQTTKSREPLRGITPATGRYSIVVEAAYGVAAVAWWARRT